MTKFEVVERLNDPNVTLIEEAYLRAIISDIECGSTATIEKMLDRVFGKAVQVVSGKVEVKTLEDLVSQAVDVTPSDDPIG